MDTAQVEEYVYSALLEDENLMEFLPNRENSIFHLQAPSVYPNYPILVYSIISDVPVLHGDNVEIMHRVTIRIHIIAAVEECPALYVEVKRIMADLGFTRLQATPFLDEDGKFMMITDWKIIIGDD